MCVHELSHKLKVSADLQVGLMSKYAEVTEASEASVSTMATKQYDQDMDLSLVLLVQMQLMVQPGVWV